MWEVVCSDEGSRVRRYEVKDGWLYQVEECWEVPTPSDEPARFDWKWSQPVFVPR